MKIAKLSDLQLILLKTAAQRADGSLLPPADSVPDHRQRISKSVASLIKLGYADERQVIDSALSWRIEGDQLIGAVISDAGRQAIGIEAEASDALPRDAAEAEAYDVPDEAVPERRPTKTALVLTLLRREQGATLAELVEATGWLPHTTHAALTGLRKKGHALAKGKREEVTCYTVAEAA